MADATEYSSGLTAAQVELVPENYFAPLDFEKVFLRRAPVEIDLGCGDGTFLTAMAARHPERNFLGIERLVGRIRSACGKAARGKLRNVRVLRVESAYAVEYLLPPASVDVIHLLFPDPWPKKRHHRRRIVTAEFLGNAHRALVPGGRLRIATDQADYFAAIRELAPASEFHESPDDETSEFPLTTFEKHFVVSGAPIYRFGLRKVSPSRKAPAVQ
ncbi:MAG: tRNA (guanosine(46)-N7)-methyltransferase TrmB [Chthoniobacterales bacterium]